MKNALIGIAFFASLAVSGCSATRDNYERCSGGIGQCQEFTRERGEQGQALTKEEALEIASRVMTGRGHNLTHYEVTYSSYKDRRWSFTFDTTHPGPKAFGSNQVVWVDETTDTTFFHPGR